MIGGVLIEISENYHAKIYLAGNYDIDWDNKLENVVLPNCGYSISTHNYRNENTRESSGITVANTINGDKSLRFTETNRYVLKLEGKDKPGINEISFQNEDNQFFKYEKDEELIIFQFVNYLGKSKLRLGARCEWLPFEVIPDKIDYEGDYIKLTEALANVCSELLLDYSGATSNVFDNSNLNRREFLLEQFIFLRKIIYEDNIQGLFESIVRNPDRVLIQDEVMKPFGIANPSKKFYKNPFSHSREWLLFSGDQSRNSCYVPQMVSVSEKHETLDTPANRFIKYAFRRFDSICIDLIQALRADDNVQSMCLEEATVLHERFDEIFRSSFFCEVGEMKTMPQNNQVLQKRNGYSQVFMAYSMVDLALKLNWKGKDNVYEGESKNVALLYEYWLFFELYRILKSINNDVLLKETDIQEAAICINDGRLNINLQQGKQSCQKFWFEKYGVMVNLYYNKTFSHKSFKNTRYEGSYTGQFRPDFTMAVFPASDNGTSLSEENAIKNGSIKYLHFDAKYRINELIDIFGKETGNLNDEEVVDEKYDSIVNTYKRGDLYKMHTYNDAIRRTVGSYVLYPGDYSEENAQKGRFKLYDEILPGVGAFAIKPSISNQGENELKQFITDVIESANKKYSRLNLLSYYSKAILSEPQIFESGELNQSFIERLKQYTDKLLDET